MYKKMLSFLLLFAALTFISMPAFAQVSLGGKVGMAFTKVRFNGGKTKLKEGFDAGFLVNVKIHDLLSLRSGVGYIQKGFRVKNNNFGFRNVDKLIFNYIEVPLLFSRDFQAPNVQTYLGMGPAVNFLVSAKSKSCMINVNSGDCETEKIPSGDFNNADISLNFGAGIGFNVGSEDAVLSFDARYFLGLTNALMESSSASSKNNGFSITMSLMFPLEQNRLKLDY